mmetsp:Transcript_34236/g.75970  ORF Transcript_34236/g.75970 Transcript_34236/m.75970 type:complete len:215 (+) Transcript_34236:773-1417(+)
MSRGGQCGPHLLRTLQRVELHVLLPEVRHHALHPLLLGPDRRQVALHCGCPPHRPLHAHLELLQPGEGGLAVLQLTCHDSCPDLATRLLALLLLLGYPHTQLHILRGAAQPLVKGGLKLSLDAGQQRRVRAEALHKGRKGLPVCVQEKVGSHARVTLLGHNGGGADGLVIAAQPVSQDGLNLLEQLGRPAGYPGEYLQEARLLRVAIYWVSCSC